MTRTDQVWCETCQHMHVPDIPKFTQRCVNCGFGSWYPSMAMAHQIEYGHGIRVQRHDLNPTAVNAYDDSHVNLILCYIHNVFEVMRPDAYRVCFECKHVYNTPLELEEAYTRITREMNVDALKSGLQPLPEHQPADLIFFCQECVHDF